MILSLFQPGQRYNLSPVNGKETMLNKHNQKLNGNIQVFSSCFNGLKTASPFRKNRFILTLYATNSEESFACKRKKMLNEIRSNKVYTCLCDISRNFGLQFKTIVKS